MDTSWTPSSPHAHTPHAARAAGGAPEARASHTPAPHSHSSRSTPTHTITATAPTTTEGAGGCHAIGEGGAGGGSQDTSQDSELPDPAAKMSPLEARRAWSESIARGSGGGGGGCGAEGVSEVLDEAIDHEEFTMLAKRQQGWFTSESTLTMQHLAPHDASLEWAHVVSSSQNSTDAWVVEARRQRAEKNEEEARRQRAEKTAAASAAAAAGQTAAASRTEAFSLPCTAGLQQLQQGGAGAAASVVGRTCSPLAAAAAAASRRWDMPMPPLQVGVAGSRSAGATGALTLGAHVPHGYAAVFAGAAGAGMDVGGAGGGIGPAVLKKSPQSQSRSPDARDAKLAGPYFTLYALHVLNVSLIR